MKLIVFILGIVVSTFCYSQNINDSTNIFKADKYLEQQKFKKAYKLYEKEAFKYKSYTLLYKAARCSELETGISYCQYFKDAKSKGFVLKEPDLFFFGCTTDYEKDPNFKGK